MLQKIQGHDGILKAKLGLDVTDYCPGVQNGVDKVDKICDLDVWVVGGSVNQDLPEANEQETQMDSG